MNVIYSPTSEQAIIAAGAHLTQLLEESKDKSILLLLSGGSAFELLDEINIKFLGSHITIAMLDERYSTNESVNNFSQLLDTDFYGVCLTLSVEFIETDVQGEETLEEYSNRFDAALRTWRMENPEGAVIATCGIGPDGHTAGIMPYPDDKSSFDSLFVNTDRWVAGYNAGDKNPHPGRATVTIPFIQHEIDSAVAYAAGENKRGALIRVIGEQGSLNDTPALVLNSIKNISLFTDIKL